jgi:hypothetical protein
MVGNTLVAAMYSVVFVGFARRSLWKSVANLSADIFNFVSGDNYQVFFDRFGVHLSIGLVEAVGVLCGDLG